MAFERKVSLFWSFLVNWNSFRPILNINSLFFSNFRKNWDLKSIAMHEDDHFSDCGISIYRSSSTLNFSILGKIRGGHAYPTQKYGTHACVFGLNRSNAERKRAFLGLKNSFFGEKQPFLGKNKEK